MEPARSIIQKLGGEKAVSEITGTAYTAPYRWQHAREQGGTNGLIPQRHHVTILQFARANGIALQAEDFLPPQPAPEPLPADPVEPRAPVLHLGG